MAARSLFVDRRESTVNEAGDYLFPLREGALGRRRRSAAELGEVLIGAAGAAQSDEELTSSSRSGSRSRTSPRPSTCSRAPKPRTPAPMVSL